MSKKTIFLKMCLISTLKLLLGCSKNKVEMSLINQLSSLKFRRDTWVRDIHLGANDIQMVSETMGVSE